jgi:hypothetical protein
MRTTLRLALALFALALLRFTAACGTHTCTNEQTITYDGGLPDGDCADPCIAACKTPVSHCGPKQPDGGGATSVLSCTCESVCLF